MSDTLTNRALTAATALIDAARQGDRVTMRHLLNEINARPLPADDTVLNIVRATADAFGTTTAQIMGEGRHSEAVEARHVACYVAHELGLTYSTIGRQIDRDHSTVMYACRNVQQTPRLLRVAEKAVKRARSAA